MNSPCIRYCKLKNNTCEGCLRTSVEIRNWSSYTEKEKRKILNKIEKKRRKSLKINKITKLFKK